MDWLREELERRMEAKPLVDEYVLLIEKGISIRNKMSHRPHFDRSVRPVMKPRERTSYDASRAIREFKSDTYALEAMLVALQRVAHDLLVGEAFKIKHFRQPPILNVAVIG
ncbi:hypothetical protein Aam_005_016 [Acidocella aminolytica 101 = DSM 11237]|uniref:Uncharacterized protein n=2 Tax=Acidocella TaxID=50709 RepID=A0A0D6PAD8_9PROT|nr:hypothetical protein Aam_005_016 [Acidocella aminolytica 101 = DSM 11237]GBQ35528.1 hypothetical protein AA11237_0996 [Acidocella aminolytica 101 = DSM 11237]